MFNIINNAVTHNKDSCTIQIKEYEKGGNIVIEIRDNGTGVPVVCLKISIRVPKTTHGIGLPMAYRIVSVHNGKFEAYNDNGFCIMMTCPEGITNFHESHLFYSFPKKYFCKSKRRFGANSKPSFLWCLLCIKCPYSSFIVSVIAMFLIRFAGVYTAMKTAKTS